MTIIVACPPLLPRLRQRRVELPSELSRANSWTFYCNNGGSVAKSYNYPAETETLVAIAGPTGDVVAWWGRTSAKGVTARSAAASALGLNERPCGYPVDWWDRRIGMPRKEAAKHVLMRLWYTYTHVPAPFTACLWCVIGAPWQR